MSRRRAVEMVVRASVNTHTSINSSMIVNADNAIRNPLKCFGFSLINLRIYALRFLIILKRIQDAESNKNCTYKPIAPAFQKTTEGIGRKHKQAAENDHCLCLGR